jgi:hypothetical protein
MQSKHDVTFTVGVLANFYCNITVAKITVPSNNSL